MNWYYNLWIIPVAFCGVPLLLLWIITTLKGHWLLKLFCILLTVGSAYTLINGINSVLGYPKWFSNPSELSEQKYFLFDVEVDAPSKIYLLVKPVGGSEFVLYAIPYSKGLGDQAASLKGQIANSGKAEIELAKPKKIVNGKIEQTVGKGDFVFYVHPPINKSDKEDTIKHPTGSP